MQIQFVHSQVHTLEQAKTILRDAASIADELAKEGREFALVFPRAVELLAARASVHLVPEQAPLDLATLKLRTG